MVNGLPLIVGALTPEHHAFSGVGYLTGKKLPEANGIAHVENGSAAGSVGSEAHTAADCTSRSLGLRLLEGHGFGQVAYPRWKAACLRERCALGRHAHKALAKINDTADEDLRWSGERGLQEQKALSLIHTDTKLPHARMPNWAHRQHHS